jgi:hypothetical protein
MGPPFFKLLRFPSFSSKGYLSSGPNTLRVNPARRYLHSVAHIINEFSTARDDPRQSLQLTCVCKDLNLSTSHRNARSMKLQQRSDPSSLTVPVECAVKSA